MKEMGLSFSTILYEYNDEGVVSVYEFDNFEFVPTNIERNISDRVNCFILNNLNFFERLVNIISESYKGAFIVEPGLF